MTTHHARGFAWLETLRQDIRYSLRQLRRNPGFTAAAIITLALGIGANTAVFTLVNGLLLRDLPVRRPERLVEVWAIRQNHEVPFSYPMFRELARGQRVFSGLIGWSGGVSSNVQANGMLSLAAVSTVTDNYYSELGVTPLLGRLIIPEQGSDYGGSTGRVAVLSYGFWQRRFGGALHIIGREIAIEGQPFTIIGVTRKWFTGMTTGESPDVTIPIAAGVDHAPLENCSLLWVSATGRLKDGVTIAAAQAQLRSFWPGLLRATTPTNAPGLRRDVFLSMGLNVLPASTGIARELRFRFAPSLYLLMGIVGLILLAACVNLANLLLSRQAARSHETSVRTALGASRAALSFQALVESLALAISGALLGLVFAYWGARLVTTLMSDGQYLTPVVLNFAPDVRVLSFTAAATILAAILCGLAPAWYCSRQDPARLLQQNPRSVAEGTGKAGKALVVAQFALSLMLLVAAGVLIRSFRNVLSVTLGFNPQKSLEVDLYPKPGGYRKINMNSYDQELLGRIAALPGVASVALSNVSLPGPVAWQQAVSTMSDTVRPNGGLTGNLALVSSGFFGALRISLVRGRDFVWTDDMRHPRVAVVSSSLAKRLFPAGNAVGERVRFGVMPDFQNLGIVGIASNARIFNLRDPAAPVIYLPALQHSGFMQYGHLFVRTDENPDALARAVGREIESLGREYPATTKTIAQGIGESLVEERAVALLSSFFAGLALLLAGVGMYGVMSYSASRRTREIGIRMALGAEGSDVLGLILGQGFKLALIGLALGIIAAFALGRFLASLLYGVTPTDPLTVIVVSLLLTAVALFACYIPARRSTKVDPMIALRYE